MIKSPLSLLKTHQTKHLSFCAVLIASLIIHVLCIDHAKLLVEEAYYWNYAQHLDWSYLDHPPMVALLIKMGTSILGLNEWGVRIPSIVCWCLTALFSYRLCELSHPQTGRYAVLLLAILPYFFFQSIIITPDVPLITCWSACLYYLFRSLLLKERYTWYLIGLWLGLGMLSKYTICLVALTTLLYVLINKESRFWFTRKEPYLAVLISIILFTPVIYWNAQHEWMSFIFQSSRRFNTVTSIHIHHLFVIVLFYITPLGILSIWTLIRTKSASSKLERTKKFCQYYTLIPLLFFAFYSLNHEVNFNWTGPLFLALIPWIALMIHQYPLQKKLWLSTATGLLIVFSSVLLVINLNNSEYLQQKVFIKVIAWDDLIKKLHAIAEKTESDHQMPVYFVPLDNYPINSELAFYQAKLLAKNRITKSYPSSGAHIFNRESLMYRYWSERSAFSGALLVLVSKEPWRFDDPEVLNHSISLSGLNAVWSVGQGKNLTNIPYYYKIVEYKA